MCSVLFFFFADDMTLVWRDVAWQMWVSASAATEDLFDTTIQPILDSYRPAGVSALGFKKVSLGTIPPKVSTESGSYVV